MPGGRPLKFKSAEELEKKIQAYFAECDRVEDTRVFKHGEPFEWKNPKGDIEYRCKECRGEILDKFHLPTRGCMLESGELKEKTRPTISGLALALGCDIETIREYRDEEGREEFSASIKGAYLRVMREHEMNLHDDRVQPAKTIFALSNFGWKNPQHIEQQVTMKKDGAAELSKALLDEGTK